MNDSASSAWKFYRFLDVKFHVYEMNTPIGKIHELPDHLKQGSNEKSYKNMKIMMIIFVSCVVGSIHDSLTGGERI
jgi:hypothetical protein